MLLIVNADDYGLTRGISRGILRAHASGVVTATSVLAVGPDLATTGSWLTAVHLQVGAHLAAVGEDPPLLSAREIPSLVDRSGRLPATWRSFVARSAAGRIDMEDVAREFAVQLQAVADLGVPLTHLDTHQHLHLWPPVAEVVVGMARRAGIGAIRVPRSWHPGPRGRGVNRLAAALAARCRAAGLRFASISVGLDQAGRLDGPTLQGVLDRLAASGAASAEICTHPGEADDAARSRYAWGFGWETELAALTDPCLPAALAGRGFTLGGHADLA